MKTLREFLKKHHACKDGYYFAKDMTLIEFLEKCERGDWILWLFVRMNPKKLRELTLAKGHCANTVRHLMKDKRSIKAVDTAIAFGEGKATREELNKAAVDAVNAVDIATAYSAAIAAVSSASADAASYAASADVYSADDAASYTASAFAFAPSASAFAFARKKSEKETADICRKYLPIELWNQEEL